MDRVLAGFIRALRAAGAEASTAEGLDAARALALVGYADRANLKAALGVALAKSEDEKSIHDRVFDQYFAPPALGHGASHADAQVQQQPAHTGDPAVDALLALAQGESSADGTPRESRWRFLARVRGCDPLPSVAVACDAIECARGCP